MSHSSRKGGTRIGARQAAALLLSAAGAGLVPCAPLVAQSSPASTLAALPRTDYEGPLVLRLPASARLLGMANVGIATTDAEAVFYNAGMLGQARGVSVSMQRYGARATASSFASVQTIGAYAIGIGAQLLHFGTNAQFWADDAARGAPRLADGGNEASSSTALTVGVGRTIKGYRLGAAARYAEERIGYDHDGALAFDVGMNKPLGPATLAVSLQNIGAGIDLGMVRGPLPTRLTVGYGGGLFPLTEHWDIGMQTAVSVERDGFVRPAGGVELGYIPIDGVAVVVRGGARLPRERDEPLATAGLGLTVDRFSFDYAMEPMRGGRPVSHRIGVRIK